MFWTILDFGKHEGKTLPQVLFLDPDWFYYALEEGYFDKNHILKQEARELYLKSRSIKIPERYGKNMETEYYFHSRDGSFARVEIVSADKPEHHGSSKTSRDTIIDLEVPRRAKKYDKSGYHNFVGTLKYILFGNDSIRMTRERCEEFFSDDSNFSLS